MITVDWSLQVIGNTCTVKHYRTSSSMVGDEYHHEETRLVAEITIPLDLLLNIIRDNEITEFCYDDDMKLLLSIARKEP
jgi:hypothetical protein